LPQPPGRATTPSQRPFSPLVVEVVDVLVVVDDVVVGAVVVVVGAVVVVVLVGGRVVVVLLDDVVLDDVVVDETVVAGGDSSSEARKATMIKTTATATINTATAQKIGLLHAERSRWSSSGGGTYSPPAGTGWLGSVGVGSTTGIARVGSSAPG
jgi:hypothetical protein